MPSPLPDDRTRTTQIALITAICVVALAIVGMGAWALLRPRPKATPRTFTPAVETTAAATVPTDAVVATETPAAESSATTPVAASQAGTAASAFVRAPKVVYRKDGTIYVAGEDGGAPKAITTAADGQYALSPDGLTLALARAGSISLYDVESGALRYTGVAEAVQPVWLPDSSAVMFMRVSQTDGPQIYRISPTGSLQTLVGSGTAVAISPDGAVVALLPEPGSTTPQVMVSRDGAPFQSVPVSGGDPIGIALSNKRLFVSAMSTAGVAGIWSTALDGTGANELVKPSATTDKGATYGRLVVSPDGGSLLYAAESDDGYSRMWVVPTAGGTAFSLSTRRDNYPLQWTVSGKDILFIEGNAFQGETTSLYHVSPTGTRRLQLVAGAGL